MVTAAYNKNVAEQISVLSSRNSMRAGIRGDEARDRVDAIAWARLRQFSPGGLAPVLVVRRTLADAFAAFLVDGTATGGHRLLVPHELWRIVWVKASATVHRVPSRKERAHREVVRLQNAAHEMMKELACTLKPKASKGPRSKRRPRKST